MAIFRRRVTDEDWFKQASPLFGEIERYVYWLKMANESQETERQSKALKELLDRLPKVKKAFDTLPDPKSADAKKACRHFRLGLKSCLDGAKAGQVMFRDIAGGPGQGVLCGRGMAQRAASGRIAFSKSLFEELIRDADNHMHQALAYFAVHRDDVQ